MIAALIFAISFMTLLQFFVSYSRSLIAESQGHELSEQAREICGLTANAVTVDQFERLQQLIALCPGARRGWLSSSSNLPIFPHGLPGAYPVQLGVSICRGMD